MQCEGRVALVTGSSSGIGRSIALTLAREGATVVVNCRRSVKDADAVVEAIRKRGGKAVAVQADVQTEAGCRELVSATEKACGRIDILVVSPGAGFNPQPFDKLDAAEAIADVSHEVTPAFRLLRLVLPGMYARKWGRIIGMGQHPTKTHRPAYAHNAAKAARVGLFLLAAEGETWANNVTVNVIAPGPVEASKSLQDAIRQCDHGEQWTSRNTTTGQDIAEAVAYLSSEAGRFITGCVLPYGFR